jgi:hypothetical protein
MGELTDDNLVVIDKKAERAIPRGEIDHIDSRPPKPTWVKEEKTSNTTDPDGTNSSSYSSGYSKGSRGDFETIFRALRRLHPKSSLQRGEGRAASGVVSGSPVFRPQPAWA